jgi:transcriptional regulator with XRE-family HTH domain
MTKSTYAGPPREWLRQASDIEDNCRSVSVGGMAADLNMLPAPVGETHRVFGRLVEYARRKQGLTLEELAEQAEVDLAEIVEIEMHDEIVPQVRTVYNLANVLNLPSGRLLEVAGLATPRPDVSSAALKFAARSEPTAQLSPEEREALEEFVKVLVETSDGSSANA